MKPITPLSGKFILRGQALGFCTLIGVMWVVELARVGHHLFGESPDFIWTRALLRTAVVLFVWLIVHITTSRLLRRLHELEEFLRLCSWCRKVNHDGRWMVLEEYFDSKFATETSHGICPDCARQQIGEYMAKRVKKPGAD